MLLTPEFKLNFDHFNRILNFNSYYFQLEEDLVRARVSRKWYLVVIVLLYIGLLASFSLNVTLLMRKPVLNQVTFPDTNYGENSFDNL